MAGNCRNDTQVSNEKVALTEVKPMECYGLKEEWIPQCRWLNRCRCENGLQPVYDNVNKIVKPTGRQCKQCADYDSCLKLGGENGVIRACRYFRKGVTNAG